MPQPKVFGPERFAMPVRARILRLIDPEHTHPPLVEQAAELREALADVADLDPVAVDVERADSERYWRRAALIQVGGQGRAILIDPLSIDDLSDLDAYLSGRLVVLHAMENDLGPLDSVGVTPPRIADTAVAAGLLGLPTGLEPLLGEMLGISLASDKQVMQRADWEARPLDPEMLSYAAADVVHLPELWEQLHARLIELDRLAWYEEELASLKAQPPIEQRRHWERVKGIGRLDGQGQRRARTLWETRERLARDTDTAPGLVLTDKMIVVLAEQPPSSLKELAARGMRRQAARRFGEELLAALRNPPHEARARQRTRRPTEADRNAADTLREIRAQRAHRLGIDPGILCPSRTLLGAVVADPSSPEQLERTLGLRRWQWDLLGVDFCRALKLIPDGNADPDRHGEEGEPMADVLDDETLARRLTSLEGWSGNAAGGIHKTYDCSDFNGCVDFLNHVARLADEANHHPDVAISWNKITLTYVTHAKGGVTEADLEQAQAVDELKI